MEQIEKYEQLLKGLPTKGMSIQGLLTSKIWPFKETKGLFF